MKSVLTVVREDPNQRIIRHRLWAQKKIHSDFQENKRIAEINHKNNHLLRHLMDINLGKAKVSSADFVTHLDLCA